MVAQKPRLRGVLHEIGFFLALPPAAVLPVVAEDGRARVAAAVFAGSVVTMFGASALYHRPTWRPRARRWLRRLDHAGIYGLIAGTYTPFGLLVLGGVWRITILAIVWSVSALSILLKLFWCDGPKWLAAVLGIALGWVGVVVYPQIVEKLGVGPALLLLAGGLFYTAGAIVYARGKPDPLPAVFGYHEFFHALTLAAVACQYVVVAVWVLKVA
jgi:hemolysin III